MPRPQITQHFPAGTTAAHINDAFIASPGLYGYTQALDAYIDQLENALQHIANPIKHMEQNLKPGEQLNGIYAIQLANSAPYLKEIAENALK